MLEQEPVVLANRWLCIVSHSKVYDAAIKYFKYYNLYFKGAEEEKLVSVVV